MNIFASDPSPILSARRLDDKRVVKMVLESAQLLSTTMTELGAPGAPYRPTHVNHPCAKWARASRGNYVWLLAHFDALLREYTARYGRVHKCASLRGVFHHATPFVPVGPRTPFANATPFKTEPDVHRAYRRALAAKWANDRRPPRWYGQKIPN